MIALHLKPALLARSRSPCSLHAPSAEWRFCRPAQERNLVRATHNQLISLVIQQLNFAEWPIYCDHSVTSAAVRLASAFEAKHRQSDTRDEPFPRASVQLIEPTPLRIIGTHFSARATLVLACFADET